MHMSNCTFPVIIKLTEKETNFMLIHYIFSWASAVD